MLAMTTRRLHIREITADDLPALLPIYLSNPAFVEQNEGSEGEIGRYDLDRWQRERGYPDFRLKDKGYYL